VVRRDYVLRRKKKKKDVTEAARIQEGVMAYKTCEKKKKKLKEAVRVMVYKS
jgi:hypothetical protein